MIHRLLHRSDHRTNADLFKAGMSGHASTVTDWTHVDIFVGAVRGLESGPAHSITTSDTSSTNFFSPAHASSASMERVHRGDGEERGGHAVPLTSIPCAMRCRSPMSSKPMASPPSSSVGT
jgi:hypothetical protein